jgi:hypothetical protein
MLRAPVKVITAAVAAVAISGAAVTAASAHESASVSRHGSEHFTLMASLTKTGEASIIATGLFTDGGTIDIGKPGRSADMKLGRGTIRLVSNNGGGFTKVNTATCLMTQTGSGSYKLSHGTGKYAGINGSGHFSTTIRSVSRHKRDGSCALNRVLAYQAVVTLTGTATLRR